jgi:hypothetical protein
MEMFKNAEEFITILIIFDLFRYLYDNEYDSENHRLMIGLIIMILKNIY